MLGIRIYRYHNVVLKEWMDAHFLSCHSSVWKQYNELGNKKDELGSIRTYYLYPSQYEIYISQCKTCGHRGMPFLARGA